MGIGRYVVTGAGGFLGRALALRLIRDGHEVIGLARKEYPELDNAGVRMHSADIGGPREFFAPVLEGADAVFHVAAKVDMWGDFAEFFRTNVIGTRNIIAACREQGVHKLVFTSSPSVIADGRDLRGVDESYPYPRKHKAHYPATKAQAEQEVLRANEIDGLATIALRPHLIFGPGDRNFVPTILARARAGRLIQVGAGNNLSDFTYIDDCVEAHLLAVKALDENPPARGQAYFISQGEETGLWSWIGRVLQLNGAPPIRRRVPKSAALAIAALAEAAHVFLPSHPEPLLTRFLVSEMTTDHYFNINKARSMLGYRPSRTIQQALESTFKRG